MIAWFPSSVFSQEPASLKEGIAQYKEENYEEAIEILTKARQEAPSSSVAAFFLGMAYKQVMNYKESFVQFRDAVTLTPRIKEALVELIDVALQLDKKEIALKWLRVAEEEEIFPAKVAFLKGLLLSKEGRRKEAVEAFEKAKSLDPSVSQAADIQIAMSYLKDNELKKAGQRFESAIVKNPQSDLAGFARQYQDLIEQRLWLERPFRFALSVFGQYDTNVVLKPTEEALATPGTQEESPVLNSAFTVNYVPRLKGPYLFNAQYAIASSLHQKNSSTHDALSNSVSLSPGYNFGEYALSLVTTYTHTLVKNPSYKAYLGTISVGPLLRMVLGENHLLEFYAGYEDNEYVQPPLNNDDEDRDGKGPTASFSWVWLFRENAFFNLRYQYNKQDTDGINWDYRGRKFSLNLIYPLSDKVKFQASGQAYFQDYENTHTTFGVIREDETYTVSTGLIWQFHKTANLIAQYTRIRGDSNLAIYDYERDLYTLGCEYVF